MLVQNQKLLLHCLTQLCQVAAAYGPPHRHLHIRPGLDQHASFATFKQGGDVGRWAAISTIWIVIPILLAGLVTLVVLIGLVYLMARALQGLPYYTGIAQDYVFKARGYIIRGADMAAKPILALDGWIESIKAFFGRMTP